MFVLLQSSAAAVRAKRGRKRSETGVIAHLARIFQWYSLAVLIVAANVLLSLKRAA